MRLRGQVLVFIAILMPVFLLLIAIVIDLGRLFIERERAQQTVQSAADAGMSVVAERMVTLVVHRQTSEAENAVGTQAPPLTETPSPKDMTEWLTEEDRRALVSREVQVEAEEEAIQIAAKNGLDVSSPDVLSLEVMFPQAGYDPADPEIDSLRLKVLARLRSTFFLPNLHGGSGIEYTATGISEIPQ